ncbi:MAG: hypothetical protein LUQ36_11320 [Methanoregula sp.]|nr:hypothetical protein [Methanoregula sp.]
MTEVTLLSTWIPWAMFVDPGLEAVLPSGMLSCLSSSPPYRMVSETGESFSVHYATGGPALPLHNGAPVAVALHNQGSGIRVIPLNRMRSRSQMRQGWYKGGFIKTGMSR